MIGSHEVSTVTMLLGFGTFVLFLAGVILYKTYRSLKK